MNNKNKVKMKRHESFSIREGWLVKGIKAIKTDPKVFSSQNATDILGMGSNMVKSLKYWLLVTKIIDDGSKKINLTKFGELLDNYDKYLDDDFSWWMLHIMMSLNSNEFYILNTFFNKCTMQSFSKEDLLETISKNLDSKNIDFNEKTLTDEINMVIKTYCIDEKIDNPENNFICPLSNLELIRKTGKNLYERNRPSMKKLNYLIVYYLILLLLENKDDMSIDDMLTIDNGPSKILNLDKNLFNEYLDEIKRSGLININRTAGLNMVYLTKRLSIEEIFAEYFDGGK